MRFKSFWILLMLLVYFPNCKPTLPLYYPQTSIQVEVVNATDTTVMEGYYTKYVIIEPKLIDNIYYEDYLFLWDAESGKTKLVLSGQSVSDTFEFTYQSRVKNLQGDEDVLYFEYYDYKISTTNVLNYKLEPLPADSLFDYKLTIIK